MKLSVEEVRHVAELAKLKLTDDEVKLYADQLSEILDYAERLQEIDTSTVAPTPYVLSLANVMRDDVAEEGLTNEEALMNSPDSDEGFFRVRAVFEE